MSLLKMLSKKLTPELLQEVQDALGDDFNYDLVPRSRLNAVIKQRDSLKEQLSAGPQDVDDDDDDLEDDDTDPKKGAKGKKADAPVTQKALNKLLAAKDKEKEDALKAQKVEFATREKLREAKAKDADIVFGLLDRSKIAFGEDGKLQGLDEQLQNLTKEKAFLFDVEDPGDKGATGTGKSGGDKGKKTDAIDDQLAGVFADFGVDIADKE